MTLEKYIELKIERYTSRLNIALQNHSWAEKFTTEAQLYRGKIQVYNSIISELMEDLKEINKQKKENSNDN